MNNLILYITDDGKSQIQLRADLGTVWLTQLEMAELFDATKQNISLHLKNLREDSELDAAATVKESLTVQTEGTRKVQRPITLYNLDAILAVGYRVRSPRGVQFRRWASTVLKEYLVKGFVMDDERLKNPDGRPDYFDEMLARIRDIRASEKRFYQKVRDLFALAADCDKSDETAQTFFATVQNLLLYAVTQKTAAELGRADRQPRQPGGPALRPAELERRPGAQARHCGGQKLLDRGRSRHPEPAGGDLSGDGRAACQAASHHQYEFLARERGADRCVQRLSVAERGRLSEPCPHGAKTGAAVSEL